MTDGLHLQQTSHPTNSTSNNASGTTTTVNSSSNNSQEDVGVSDLLFLEPLTEQSFIDNLRRRFHADKIYTSMGTLLLSVNPYRPLPLYDEAILRTYRTCKTSNLPPHIFGAATAAYRDLTGHGANQVLILNGECGSGKTEMSKLIMDVVASLASKTRESDLINNRLIIFGHILAAFGNAKTEKNDNASRFGQYTDVAFNSHGETVGAIVTTYQLDKSRVVSQGPRERNFHVFYQILAGADVHLLKSLKLQRNAEKYSLLRAGGVYKIDGLDERREFVITKDALDVLGFSTAECQSVFQILAAVLKLGNLQFLPKTNVDGTESCTVLNEHEIHEVSELLECSDSKRFMSVLTTGLVQMKADLMETALSAQEASRLRDQLCKALYNRLFTWIVAKINSCLSYSSSSSRTYLGVLDLYGFECFEKNGFEQFVINYTAEKLHQVVSDMIMKYEQEEYVKENIAWTLVPYAGSNEVCDLIEKGNHSLLTVLDEICHKDEVTSGEQLLHKFSRYHPQDRNFLPPLERPTNNVPMDQFKIRHFAGTVTYSSQTFVQKNMDMVDHSLAELIYLCRHQLAKELFPDGNPARTIGKKPVTIATHLKVSLTSLLSSIANRSTTLITCIKPNDLRRPNFFDEEKVKHQIRYMGLVDQVRVRRAGFAFRQSYDGFLKHYKMISQLTWPTWDGDPKDGVRLLLLDLKPEGVMPIEYVFGRTKIFVKYYETIHLMDELREKALENIAVIIQKTFRGYRSRKSVSTSTSAQSSSHSSKDSSARPAPGAGRMSKLLMRSLYND
ncbi:Unconventional myosin-Ib, partial [Hypsibius exemplaris]